MSHAEQIEALKGLLERVKAAEWPERRLDTHLHWFLVHGVKPDASMRPSPDIHTYTQSVDAALWLVGHIAPNHGYSIRRSDPSMKPVATLFAPIELPDAPIDDGRSWARPTDGTGATDALALISALLSAKLALLTQEESR